MFGLINLDKPSGMSSRKAIDRVQDLVRPAKVGHTGTLDPLAEGVLVVTVGPATRLTSHVQNWVKSYQGTFRLGCTSETEDVEGDVVQLVNARRPTRDELQDVLGRFRGVITQRPPKYSALKVGGRRAYQLARRGKEVNLSAREIVVHELSIERYAYPELELCIRCGSGTYVRSLGRDIARAVGTDAVMSSLTRTAVGHLDRTNAVPPSVLTQDNLGEYLLPATEAVHDLPQIVVSEAQLKQMENGHEIELPGQTAHELAAISPDGMLAALMAHQGGQRFRPTRNFVAHTRQTTLEGTS